eukprot:3345202-Pyramimonas_sp.AAC.1
MYGVALDNIGRGFFLLSSFLASRFARLGGESGAETERVDTTNGAGGPQKRRPRGDSQGICIPKAGRVGACRTTHDNEARGNESYHRGDLSKTGNARRIEIEIDLRSYLLGDELRPEGAVQVHEHLRVGLALLLHRRPGDGVVQRLEVVNLAVRHDGDVWLDKRLVPARVGVHDGEALVAQRPVPLLGPPGRPALAVGAARRHAVAQRAHHRLGAAHGGVVALVVVDHSKNTARLGHQHRLVRLVGGG